MPHRICEYLTWVVSPERQRHEWQRQRRALVAARIRIVVYGHLFFFAACVGVQALGWTQAARFSTCGWVSLLIASVGLAAAEWLHVRTRQHPPPRFVIRDNGLTEYSADGPRGHWDWTRTRALSIETDRRNPSYRSLVLRMSGAVWLERLQCVHIPLPQEERDVVAAILQALEANGIRLEPAGGAVALIASRA